MIKYFSIAIVVFSAFLAACSQVLLKKSAVREYNNKIREYINVYVIVSYMVLFLTSIMNMYALQYIEYKIVPAIGTISYVFVILISRLILKEKINRKKFLGITVILLGIMIFQL